MASADIEAAPGKIVSPRLHPALGMALKAKGDTQGTREALAGAKQYKHTGERAEEELVALGPADPRGGVGRGCQWTLGPRRQMLMRS